MVIQLDCKSGNFSKRSSFSILNLSPFLSIMWVLLNDSVMTLFATLYVLIAKGNFLPSKKIFSSIKPSHLPLLVKNKYLSCLSFLLLTSAFHILCLFLIFRDFLGLIAAYHSLSLCLVISQFSLFLTFSLSLSLRRCGVHIKHLASLITGYLSHNLFVMTPIAQLIKTSEYVCTGRDPVQASAVFLNELIISLSVLP